MVEDRPERTASSLLARACAEHRASHTCQSVMDSFETQQCNAVQCSSSSSHILNFASYLQQGRVRQVQAF